MNSQFKVVSDFILIQLDPELGNKQTGSGIYMPTTMQDEYMSGTIISAG